MKYKNFLAIGINIALNTVDKIQYYKVTSNLFFHEIKNIDFLGNFLVANNLSDEKSIIKKSQITNKESLERRLNLLGDEIFCLWGCEQLNTDKKSPNDFYDLILRNKINNNKSYNDLTDAICNSLKRNTYIGDYRTESINDHELPANIIKKLKPK